MCPTDSGLGGLGRDEFRCLVPRNNRNAFGDKVLGASVDKVTRGLSIRSHFFPFLQALEIVGVQRFPGLDLDGDEACSLVDDDVDFITQVIPPEMEVRCQPVVEPVFYQLGDDEAFEQAALLRMDGQMLRALNVQQPGGQPTIIEIELGRLDQPLSEILMMRPQQENNVAGFKDG